MKVGENIGLGERGENCKKGKDGMLGGQWRNYIRQEGRLVKVCNFHLKYIVFRKVPSRLGVSDDVCIR